MTQALNAKHLLRAAALATALCAPLAGFAAGTFLNGQSYYGQPAPATTAVRVVDVGAAKYLNVAYGETVSFRAGGGQVFTWTFNGLDQRAVDLVQIAPSGFASQPLRIFVGRNTLTRG